jgi:hypothetical protein
MFSGLSVFPGSLSFYIGGHMVMIVVVHDQEGVELYCTVRRYSSYVRM